MKGTTMLLDNKGNNVAIPSGFDKMNRQSQGFFLAPLREVLVPSKGTVPMFALGARARLKQ